jgi:ABC-type iron transport system FetAB permease component
MEMILLTIATLIQSGIIGFLLNRVFRLSKQINERNEVLDRYIALRARELGLK